MRRTDRHDIQGFRHPQPGVAIGRVSQFPTIAALGDNAMLIDEPIAERLSGFVMGP
jgi:hypothetical protein